MSPSSLLRSLRDYWFYPAPVVNLAVCRIFAVGAILRFRYNLHGRSFGPEGFEELYALPDALYDPLPALHLMMWPVDWMYRPTPDVLQALFWIGLAAGVLALVGLLTNASLALFALVSLFLQTHAYSYGNFHHTVAVVLIAVGVLALSPCGRVLSVDRAIRRWRARRRRKRAGGAADPDRAEPGWLEARSEYAAWGPKLIGWLLVLVYLSAALSKVGDGKGADWMNGYTLQFYLLRDGLRWEMPLGVWASQFHGLAVVLSWFTVLFEATFALALLGPLWLTVVYVMAGLGLHMGIYATMAAPFFGFMALYSALVPWDRLFRFRRRERAEPVVLEPSRLRTVSAASQYTTR